MKKWLGLVGVYLGTRLINLTNLPIFSDEALYLRWAQIVNDQGFWVEPFISLRDGKEPLHPWLLSLVYPRFSDPLLAGRLVSVGVGLGTVVMVYLLARELFDGGDGGKEVGEGSKGGGVAFWATLTYVILPFPLVYDRLAIIDSLLSLTAALTMWGLVRFSKRPGWKTAGVVGMAWGLALLTKSIARVWLPLVVVTPWWLGWGLKRSVVGEGGGRGDEGVIGRTGGRLKTLLTAVGGRRWGWIGVLAGVVGVINLPFWLHPGFSKVAAKNSIFLYKFLEILGDPVGIWGRNLSLTLRWLGGYHGWGLLVFVLGVVLASVMSELKIRGCLTGRMRASEARGLLWLAAWMVWPILVEVLVAKIYFPRYFLFTTISVAVVAGWGIARLVQSAKCKVRSYECVGMFLFVGALWAWPAYLSYGVVKGVEAAPLPMIERWQLLESWPAGQGLREAAGFLKEESREGPITIVMEDIILLTHGLPLYLEGEEVRFETVDLQGGKLPKVSSEVGRVYWVTTLAQRVPEEWGLKVVAEWPKVGGREALRVWRRRGGVW